MSEWPSTYVSILVCSRPQCAAAVGASVTTTSSKVSSSSSSFAPSSGSAFSSVSKAVKKTHQQMQQLLHPSALSSYYSTSSSSAPGGGAYYLGWNRLQEQLRNQQVFTLLMGGEARCIGFLSLLLYFDLIFAFVFSFHRCQCFVLKFAVVPSTGVALFYFEWLLLSFCGVRG